MRKPHGMNESRKTGLREKILLSLILCCGALALLPFFVSMFFAFPIADDLRRANQARYMFDMASALQEVASAYWSWSGRVTHHFLVVFLGDAAMSRASYGLVTMFVVLVYWIALFGILNELQGRRNRSVSFSLATVCLLAFLAMHPNLRLLYIITNTLGLTIGNGFILVFIWSLCKLWNRTDFSLGMKLFVFGSGIAALGSYEHSTIMACLVAVGAYGIARSLDHPNLGSFRLTAVVIGVGCLLSLGAPGNFARNEQRDVSFEQMLEQLRMALPIWKIHALNAMKSPLLMVAALLGIVIPPRLRLLIQKRLPVLHVIAGTGMMFACLSLGIVLLHALSDQPIGISPSKLTASMSQLSSYIFTTMFMMLGCYLTEHTRKVPPALAGIVLGFYCITTPNYWNTVRTLASGAGSAYAATWEKRHLYIRKNQGKDLVVSRLLLHPFPMNVYGDAIPADRDSWFAQATPQFFGVRKIFSASPSKDGAALGLADGEIRYPHVTRVMASGMNTTFQHVWLALREPAPAGEVYHVLVFLRNPVPDFLPGVVRTRLRNELASRQALRSSSWPAFFGIESTNSLADTRVRKAGEATHLIPIAAAEWGSVEAVYGSFDGETFTRVYLADG